MFMRGYPEGLLDHSEGAVLIIDQQPTDVLQSRGKVACHAHERRWELAKAEYLQRFHYIYHILQT